MAIRAKPRDVKILFNKNLAGWPLARYSIYRDDIIKLLALSEIPAEWNLSPTEKKQKEPDFYTNLRKGSRISPFGIIGIRELDGKMPTIATNLNPLNRRQHRMLAVEWLNSKYCYSDYDCTISFDLSQHRNKSSSQATDNKSKTSEPVDHVDKSQISGTLSRELTQIEQDVSETNHHTNGILMRSDIHTLFDLGLIFITDSYQVAVDARLKGSIYEKYNEKRLLLPNDRKHYPRVGALRIRNKSKHSF